MALWPQRDTCYFIASPNPNFATEGVAHTQNGVTLHYFRIKFGDGSFLTPGRYDTCNADFYASDNTNTLEGIYRTPIGDQYGLRRCGKFLERMVLQDVGYHYHDQNGNKQVAVLEQITNAGGGDTEWYRIWARPNEIAALGNLLVQLINNFPNASFGLTAMVPNVLNHYNVHDETAYNNLNADQQDEFNNDLAEACVREATAYATGPQGGSGGVVAALVGASRTFQNP